MNVESRAQKPLHSGNKTKKRSWWRYVWLGLALSAMLWFVPNIYLQKNLRYAEMELHSGELSQSDYHSIMRSNRRYFLACKIAASILLFGSVLYPISQLERGRPQ